MNDWTQETANNYEAFLAEERAAAQRKSSRASEVKEGSKILVTNNRWQGRREESPTWHTVQKVTRYSDGITEIVCTDGRVLNENALILVEANRAQTETLLIHLDARTEDFWRAVNQESDEHLEVYEDYERNAFVVVNRAHLSEYKVYFLTNDFGIFANCECKSFRFGNRLCKHLKEVLRFTESVWKKAEMQISEVV